MQRYSEITWTHVAHGLKLAVVATAIVLPVLWGFSALEIALVDGGGGGFATKPPDSACLYFALKIAVGSVFYFVSRQIESVIRSGRIALFGRDALFALIDFSAIVTVTMLATSRALFFGFMSFAFFPGPFFGALYLLPRETKIGERIAKAFGFALTLVAVGNFFMWWIVFQFYAFESADIQSAKGLSINAAVFLAPLFVQSAGAVISETMLELFGRRNADADGSVAARKESLRDVNADTAAEGDPAADVVTINDSRKDDSVSSGEREGLEEELVQVHRELNNTFVIATGVDFVGAMALLRVGSSFFWIGLCLDIFTRPALRALACVLTAASRRWTQRRRQSQGGSGAAISPTHAEGAAPVATRTPSSCATTTVRQIVQSVLYVDADPQRDYHFKAARYVALPGAAVTGWLYFSLDSPAMSATQRASVVCARRLAGSTVMSSAGRFAAIFGANLVVDVAVLAVRACVRSGRVRQVTPFAEAAAEAWSAHVFVSLWTAGLAAATIVVFACSIIMFLRGAYVLDPCGP
ncbi:hypothetical protein DFJ73DRAFT_140155 [Zopfochytrium polystomum]|nr:hypothetical protein DFJ73DRAFT_140155 [Zopfochytrium polystomum]